MHARLPADPAPDGWRTEYYRDISFEVPETWGHAHEPGSDWCVASNDSQPEPRHRQPYVSLGRQPVCATVACLDPPTGLTTEHVLVYELAPNEDVSAEEGKDGAFWIIPRIVSGQLLVVTSKDEALARRIADSIKVRPEPAPCDPDHQLAANRSGPAGTGVRRGGGPGCRFDGDLPVRERSGGRRSAACGPWSGWTLTEPAPSSTRSRPRRSCSPGPVRPRSGGTSLCSSGSRPTGLLRELHLQAGGCADGTTPYGGFDDGTNVRTLTKAGCKAVLVSPAELWGSGGYVGNACLG